MPTRLLFILMESREWYLDGASLGEGGRLGDVEGGGESKGGHGGRERDELCGCVCKMAATLQ